MILYLIVCERSESRISGWWKALHQPDADVKYTQPFVYTKSDDDSGLWSGTLAELDRVVFHDEQIALLSEHAVMAGLGPVLFRGNDEHVMYRVDRSVPPQTLTVVRERKTYSRFVHSKRVRAELRKRNTLNVPMLVDLAKRDMSEEQYARFLRCHYAYQRRRRGLEKSNKHTLQERVASLEERLRHIFHEKQLVTFDRYPEPVKRAVVRAHPDRARAIAARWPEVPDVEISDGVYEELLSQFWREHV